MVSYKDVKLFTVSALFTICAAGQGDKTWRRAPKESHRREYADYQDHGDVGYGQDDVRHDQENYFQEIYMLQSAPKQIEFGHVCENADEWQQRYEKKDFDRNRHQGKDVRKTRCEKWRLSMTRGLQNCCSYQHLPEAEEYEAGYRRGNDDHVRERFEKADPGEGRFTTKVRWADRKGGHGEHYWDYNHSGHAGDLEGDYSADATTPVRQHQKRQLTEEAEEAEAKPPEVEGGSRSREAEEFLRSFREEIGGAFGLQLQERKLSNRQKAVPEQLSRRILPKAAGGFPFALHLHPKVPSSAGSQ